MSSLFCLLLVSISSLALLWRLVSLLELSFDIVLGEVAVLTHALRVVWLVRVAALVRHLALAAPVVAVVTHALGVVHAVSVRAL